MLIEARGRATHDLAAPTPAAAEILVRSKPFPIRKHVRARSPNITFA